MEAAEELENAGGLKGSSCRGLEEEGQAGGFRAAGSKVRAV